MLYEIIFFDIMFHEKTFDDILFYHIKYHVSSVKMRVLRHGGGGKGGARACAGMMSLPGHNDRDTIFADRAT